MALFTDGTIARIEDLRALESAVLDHASSEGIDISAKLEVAQRELGTELIPFLMRRGCRDLSRVMVTDAMLGAHALRTLEMIYRDLYQSRLNDRFEGKWRAYAAQSERAMRALLESGVGITMAPLPKPAAPVVEAAFGGVLPARTYYVRIAFTRGDRLTGALSEPGSSQLAPGTIASVQPPQIPQGVTGWVVYAGATAESTTLQTETELDGSSTWLEPAPGLRSDLKSWRVQMPDFYLENRREILRG